MSGIKRAVVEAYSPVEDLSSPISDQARALFFKFFPEVNGGHVVARTDNRVIDVNQNSGQVFYPDPRFYLGRVMFEDTKKRLGTKVMQLSDVVAELLEKEMPEEELVGVEFSELYTYEMKMRRGVTANILAMRAKIEKDQVPPRPNFVAALQSTLSDRITSEILDDYTITENFDGAVPLAQLTQDVVESDRYPHYLANLSELLPISGIVILGGEVGGVGEGTSTIIETRS